MTHGSPTTLILLCTRFRSTSCAGRSGRHSGPSERAKLCQPISTLSRSGSLEPTLTWEAAIENGFLTSPFFGWRSASKSATGLALETENVRRSTATRLLGPQHSVAEGWIFTWSGLFPFIRLIKQAMEAIPPLRLKLFGTWRSSKLPRGEETINESIHDSVVDRFGQQVVELHHGRSRIITYEPRNLAPMIREHTAQMAKPQRNASRHEGHRAARLLPTRPTQ